MPSPIGPTEQYTPNPAPTVSRRRRSAQLSLNLTSMIDVVFLLLIYFMVATEFKAGEEVYRLDLPDRQPSKQQQDPFDLDDEPLRIRLTSSGITSNACRIRVEGPYRQPSSFDDLYDFLVSRQIGPHSTMGLFEPDHPIIIVPTPDTRWDHAIEAFNTAVRAQYQNLTLARPE